jgi:ABC-type nickel/cobalt efflux system permease component RcnA
VKENVTISFNTNTPLFSTASMFMMGGLTMLRVVYLALLSLPVKGTLKGCTKNKNKQKRIHD